MTIPRSSPPCASAPEIFTTRSEVLTHEYDRMVSSICAQCHMRRECAAMALTPQQGDTWRQYGDVYVCGTWLPLEDSPARRRALAKIRKEIAHGRKTAA